MKFKFARLRFIITVFKSSFKLFASHDTFTLGAALSYYTVFSIAPVLVIVISLVGAILGPEAVQGEIKAQIEGFLGSTGAQQLQDLIKAVYQPGRNILATIIAIILLVVGATSVFGQLRTSLNYIWDVKPSAKKPVVKFLIDRLFSFGMIICLAFLMLIALVIQAGIAGFTTFLSARFSWFSVWIAQAIEAILSIGISTALFALVYRYLSDAKLPWSRIWEGAVFTAVLFAVGKYLIGLYIGKTNLADTYGAVGSGVLILAWVFYSSQILFFGATFTQALAMHRGISLNTQAIESHGHAAEKGRQMEAGREPPETKGKFSSS